VYHNVNWLGDIPTNFDIRISNSIIKSLRSEKLRMDSLIEYMNVIR